METNRATPRFSRNTQTPSLYRTATLPNEAHHQVDAKRVIPIRFYTAEGSSFRGSSPVVDQLPSVTVDVTVAPQHEPFRRALPNNKQRESIRHTPYRAVHNSLVAVSSIVDAATLARPSRRHRRDTSRAGV